MTETHSGAPFADDIIDDEDTRTARLDRRADAFLAEAEGRGFRPTTSVRQAIREDIRQGRAWARHRAERSREAIREEPIRAAAYAMSAGMLIGLLLRR